MSDLERRFNEFWCKWRHAGLWRPDPHGGFSCPKCFRCWLVR